LNFLCDINKLIKKSIITASSISQGDKEYIVISHKNDIFVYLNRCPHLNKTLNSRPETLLDKHNNFILCANHNALFTIDQGLCIKGPCKGQTLQKVAYKIVGEQLLINS